MSYQVHYTASRAAEASEWAPLVEKLEGEPKQRTRDVALADARPMLVLPPATTSLDAAVLDGIETTSSSHIVVVSSSRAQGLSERNPGFLTEAEKRGARDPEAKAWRRYEKRISLVVESNLAHPEVTILRCCPVLGSPDRLARLFEGRVLWTWLGYDPPIQLLSLERLAVVLDRIGMLQAAPAQSPIPAPNPTQSTAKPTLLYVAPDDAERISDLCRKRGVTRCMGPGFLHRIAARLSRASEAASFDQRRFLRFPFTVSNRQLLDRLGLETLGTTLESATLGSKVARSARRIDRDRRDSYGMDSGVIRRLQAWFLKPAARWYWRVAAKGIERFPKQGPTLLVGVHRGYIPLDAMMLMHLILEGTGRYLRTLIHPALVMMPFLSTFLPAIGGRIASKANTDRVLEEGGALAVYPEGASGAMVKTSKAYPLRPFLSIEFARAAVRHNAVVVPVVAVGPAETLPVFKQINWGWWKKRSGWPTLPVGFLFPFGPPIPLPAKWHIVFLDPIKPEEINSEDDEMRAQELAATVRRRLEEQLERLLRARRSVWRGSLFVDEVDE